MQMSPAFKTDSKIRIRPTRSADLAFVIEAEQHSDNAPYVNQWSVEEHERAITSPHYGHFIAEKIASPGTQADTRVGYLLLNGLQDPHQNLLIQRVVVVPKRQGYGRKMLRWTKAFAFEQLGIHRLWLDVIISNQRAQALYLSEGFSVEGTMREAYKNEQGFEDMLLLSLLRSEYRQSD